jgi:hypothetical protein
VLFASRDAGSGSPDDAFTPMGMDAAFDAASPPLDAAIDPLLDVPLDLPDVVLDLDAPLGLPDAGGVVLDPDAFVAPDAGGRRVLVVTNTAGSGVGSLEDAIATVNTTCSLMPTTIAFDIPSTDPGFVATPTGGYWRISSLTTRSLTCAGTVIDGTTQTAARGDTNPFVVAGVAAGAGGAFLPRIRGPEIELRGITLQNSAPSVVLRGLAFQAYLGSGPALTIEQCFLGSEPDSFTPLPPTERLPDGSVFYTESCSGCMVRESVFMAANGPTGATYNLFSFRSGSVGATLRDSYFGGSVTGAGAWDLLYLVTAEDHRIVHNYLGALGYEYYVEWVPGYGGDISENTFVGVPSEPQAISMGGAATMTGNVFLLEL